MGQVVWVLSTPIQEMGVVWEDFCLLFEPQDLLILQGDAVVSLRSLTLGMTALSPLIKIVAEKEALDNRGLQSEPLLKVTHRSSKQILKILEEADHVWQMG